MAEQLTLPTCAIPGCQFPVGEWGAFCLGCVTEFGDFLRPCATSLTEAEIRARDTEVRRQYARHRVAS